MNRWQKFWHLIKLTKRKWQTENIAWMSAALAYYTLFSMAPMFILVVAIFGRIFGEEAVKGQIVEKIHGLVGDNTAHAIERMIESGMHMATLSVANLIGIAVIIYAATNVFAQLKNAIDEIWDAPARERHWVMNILWERLVSFLMILSIGLLLFCLVLVDISLAAFDKVLSRYLPMFTEIDIWRFASLVISFIIITLLFAVIYRILPDVKIEWSDIWGGAVLSSLLFTLGKFLIAIYLSNSRTITLFGAASSFVVILIWVSISSQILLLGAAYTHFYAKEFGSLAKKKNEENSREEADKSIDDVSAEPS